MSGPLENLYVLRTIFHNDITLGAELPPVRISI